MGVKTEIRPTRPEDVEALIANLRESDLIECIAYGRDDIPAGIRSSVNRSVLCWTGLADGEVASIMGCTPLNMLAGIGSPWMLGTPLLDRHSRVLVRETPAYIARMLSIFPHLFNLVHVENTTSVRWLRRVGFTLHAPVPYGEMGEMFHPFEMKASNV